MRYFLPAVLPMLALLLMGALPAPLYAQRHFTDCSTHTGQNATVVIPALADPRIGKEPLAAGDEIAVLAPSGRCAGSTVWTGENIALTVWGDDEMTEAPEGIEPGALMEFSVWDASQQVEYNASNSNVEAVFAADQPYLESSARYTTDGIYVIEYLQVTPLEPTAQ